MTKSRLRFYHRYYEDGSCKVICMDCYETLGTGQDRQAAVRMEAGHVCRGRLRAADGAGSSAKDAGSLASPLAEMQPVGFSERMLARVHPALLLLLTVVVLYAIPTVLEILARSEVNTWVAVILPGNAIGCAVLITIMRLPRTGLVLYLVLAGCECWLHMTHTMRGVTMAWIVDLVPTLVVLGLLIVRLQKTGGTRQTAPG